MQLHKNRDCLVEHGVLTACGTLPLDHQQHLGLDLSTASLLDGLCPFVVTCMKTSKQRRSDDVFDTDCDVSNLSMACDANVTEQGPCAKLTHDQWRELLSEARAIWFHQVCPVSFVFFFFHTTCRHWKVVILLPSATPMTLLSRNCSFQMRTRLPMMTMMDLVSKHS